VKGHTYVPGPSLFTRGDRITVTHTPGCRCGWRSDKEYADAIVAKQAWELHREDARRNA
jgi:hypothetical protein